MATTTVSANGSAAPELVWQRYRDLGCWPTWSPQIARVETEPASATALAAGLTGRVLPVVGPGVPFEVLAVDEVARRWSWRVRIAGVSVVMEHTVTPTADGTSAGLLLDGPLLLIAGYAPLARIALGRLVAA